MRRSSWGRTCIVAEGEAPAGGRGRRRFATSRHDVGEKGSGRAGRSARGRVIIADPSSFAWFPSRRPGASTISLRVFAAPRRGESGPIAAEGCPVLPRAESARHSDFAAGSSAKSGRFSIGPGPLIRPAARPRPLEAGGFLFGLEIGDREWDRRRLRTAGTRLEERFFRSQIRLIFPPAS